MHTPAFRETTVSISPNVQHIGQPRKQTRAATAGSKAHQPMTGA